MVCATCEWGVGVGLLQVVPSFASLYMNSLPKNLMCALAFCIVMLCLIHGIWWTMVEISSLSGWLC